MKNLAKDGGHARARSRLLSQRQFSCLLRNLSAVTALAALLASAGCIGLSSSPKGGGGTSTPPSSGSSGSGGATLTASSSQVAFGDLTVGSSTSQLVTLTASGHSNVTISTVSATGPGFSVSGGSGMTLMPNKSVTVSVNFEPRSNGDASGKLLVKSSASNGLLQIPLSGKGVSSAVQHSVTLSWQASTSRVIGYLIFRGAAQGELRKLNPAVDSATTYTDKTVAGGTTYVYAVKSVGSNGADSSFSNQVTVTTPSP